MTQIDTPAGGWTSSAPWNNELLKGALAPNAEITLGMDNNTGYIARECSTLKKLSLPNLKTSSGTIANGCSNLTEISIPLLTTVSINGTNLGVILSCGNLTKCEFSSMTSLTCLGTYCAILRSSASVKDWYFPKLKTYSTSGRSIFMDCGTMNSVSMPSLETAYQYLIGYSYTSTTSQPKFKNIYVGCAGSTTITIAAMTSDTYCEKIEIGDYENINIGLEPRWHPSQNIVITNFNGLTRENVVTYILERLKDNTGNTKFTLTIPSAIYELLTDDDKLIISSKNWGLAYK